jgi:hypothetical protein
MKFIGLTIIAGLLSLVASLAIVMLPDVTAAKVFATVIFLIMMSIYYFAYNVLEVLRGIQYELYCQNHPENDEEEVEILYFAYSVLQELRGIKYELYCQNHPENDEVEVGSGSL